MHRLYLAWFTWGFYLKIGFVAALAIAGALSFYSKKVAMTTGGISMAVYALNAAGWLVAGGIWRFSNAGSVASGEKLDRPAGVSDEDWAASIELSTATNGYQISSAKFIKAYVIFGIVLVSVALIAGIIGAFVMMCSPTKDEESSALLKNDKSTSKSDKEKRRDGDEKRSKDRSRSKKRDKEDDDLL